MSAMTVERLGDGLWRWTAPHPGWREGGGWDPDVGSVYCETPEAIILIDPLVPGLGPDRDRFWRALDGDVARLALPVVVLLTCRWHVRSADLVRHRYGARILGPSGAGPGLADVGAVAVGDRDWPVAGIQALASGMPAPEEELLYWIPAHAALVPGDVVLGGDPSGLRIAPADWYEDSAEERAWYAGGLRERLGRLVDLAPRMVLVAHGEPVRDGGAAALRAALEATSG